MSRFLSIGRQIGVASLAGVLSGVVVGGLLGRLAMRVAGFTSRPELIGVQTSNGNRVGDVTFAGTIALVVFVGIASGMIGGLLYASAEPWLRARRGKGAIFGLALLLAFGTTSIEPGNFDFERFGFAALNVLMFALLFIAFGIGTAAAYDPIRRVIERPGVLPTAVEAAAWVTGVLSVIVAAVSLFSIGGLDDVPLLLWVGVALIVPPIVLWRRLPRPLGYAAFALPVVVGGFKLLSGLPQLLD